jgi:hypothetical protein
MESGVTNSEITNSDLAFYGAVTTVGVVVGLAGLWELFYSGVDTLVVLSLVGSLLLVVSGCAGLVRPDSYEPMSPEAAGLTLVGAVLIVLATVVSVL